MIRTRQRQFIDRHFRERMFNPELPPDEWPYIDDDNGANWDYLVTIICAFGIAATLGVIVIFAWVGLMVLGWP